MASAFSNVIEKQFDAPIPHPELTLTKHLKGMHPGSHLVPTIVPFDSTFPLSGYLETLGITLSILEPGTHCVFAYDNTPDVRKLLTQIITGVSTFTYSTIEFRVYKASWSTSCGSCIYYGLVFEGTDDAIGQQLTLEVYKWANDLKDEIWVYEGGMWSKNKELYTSIQQANWDDIVLREAFKEGLRRDTNSFFSSRNTYRSLNITWKRGILLLGPPGNGKTESIKALLNEFDYAALYVKSFVTHRGPEHGIRSIFDHARKHSPCILILEDLDSMVTEAVRSFFSNEIDGLTKNDGILTIATTNHPERIDDAILNRPSRFDVKYNFGLPEDDLRAAFAAKWIRKIQALENSAATESAGGLGIVFNKSVEDIAKEVADKTDGWSFAFLKELFVSFLLRVAHDRSLQVASDEGYFSSSGPGGMGTALAIIKPTEEKSSADASEAKRPTTFSFPFMPATVMHANPTAFLGSSF